MTKAKKILFISQEMVPYVPESNLATFGRQLPQAIQEKSREIRTFMPKWGIINERRNQLHEVIRLSGMNLIINNTDHPLIIKVASISAARMQVYFIDNDDYFSHRKMTFDENGAAYADNVERAIFYAKGVLETVKKLRWIPDVIHCQGWISSIVPLYIKTVFKDEPSFRDCRVVYTPSAEEQSIVLPDNLQDLLKYKNLDCEEALQGITETMDMQLLNKLAVKYADGICLLETDNAAAQYAKNSGKPCIETPDLANMGDSHSAFYDEVWGEGRVENSEEDE